MLIEGDIFVEGPESDVGTLESCAACLDSEHGVHECMLPNLGRTCVDGREQKSRRVEGEEEWTRVDEE